LFRLSKIFPMRPEILHARFRAAEEIGHFSNGEQ
jgi:hypothetical protein